MKQSAKEWFVGCRSSNKWNGVESCGTQWEIHRIELATDEIIDINKWVGRSNSEWKRVQKIEKELMRVRRRGRKWKKVKTISTYVLRS